MLKGLDYYNLALQLAGSCVPSEEWVDMCGMIAPLQSIEDLLLDIDENIVKTTESIEKKLLEIHNDCAAEVNMELDPIAREEWLELVRGDAQREFGMGDVDEEQLNSFLEGVH